MAKKNAKLSLGPVIGPNTRLAACDRDGDVSTVVVHRPQEGEPIHDDEELAHIDNPECMCGHWQEMTPLHGEGRATASGPAQVATEAYRDGYDRIFGKKPTVGLA